MKYFKKLLDGLTYIFFFILMFSSDFSEIPCAWRLEINMFFSSFFLFATVLILKLPVLSSFQEEGQKEKGNTCLAAEDLKKQIPQGLVVAQMNQVITWEERKTVAKISKEGP